MLTPTQIIPYLDHDDRILRQYALDYFRWCSDPAPLTAEDYWRTLDKFGETKLVRSWGRALEDAPQTERSLERLLRALAAEPAGEFTEYYQSALRKLSLPILEAHREEVLGCPSLAPKVRAHLERRVALRDEPSDALWKLLMNEGRALAGKYIDAIDTSKSDALVDALGHRNDEATCPNAVAVLDDPTNDEDYRLIFAIRVLGRRRYEPAVSRLVKLFAVDDDLTPQETGRALARIGTPEVIEKILEFYPAQEWGPRLSAMEPLSWIKRPESEAALLKLIEIETAPDLIVFLLQRLTDLGSLAGLEISRGFIAGDDDPEAQVIAEKLLAIATITGMELPEAAKWRAAAEARYRRWDNDPILDELLAKSRGHFTDDEAFDNDEEDFDELPALPSFSELSARDEVIEPIRRTAPKVGRNDPCPCGSGKKYKKCCLGKDG